MTKLIKSDLARIVKDKLFLVVCILGVIFAVITPLLYQLLFSGMDMADDVITTSLISAKSQFFSAFSLSNNFGLVVPVLIAIILCKDFSFGTIRNKIISGHSRSSIFLSMYTACAVTLWGIILLHALLTLGISLLFFEYQPGGFTANDLWYLLQSVAFQMLVYLFIAAVACWLCAAMKNVGLVIVLYVAIVLAMTMISAILLMSISVLEWDTGNETTVRILEFFQRINIFYYSSVIGQLAEYSTQDVLYLTLTPTVGIIAFLGLGLLKFSRKDLK